MGLDKEDIKQLIAILQKGLGDDLDDDNEEVLEPRPPATKNTKQKSKKKYKNLFEQMSESRMHKDDIEIDKKLSKFPPTQRARNYKPINARCRVCGKNEQVNPSLVESIERYKCNKCCTSSG